MSQKAFYDIQKIYWLPQHVGSGVEEMALDEALLTWALSSMDIPVLIARTYQWQPETLSFGVHQSKSSIDEALTQYTASAIPAVVRRPTGGRAILHGKDISFAFVTNSPVLSKLKLSDSYCIFSTLIRQALDALKVPLLVSCETNDRAYTRSALCFETQTPSDLISTTGQKVAGSAQLRRHHGILQHGAAFVSPFHVVASDFDDAVYREVSKASEATPIVLTPENEPALYTLWLDLQKAYQAEALSILDRLLITSGSHLAPDSD